MYISIHLEDSNILQTRCLLRYVGPVGCIFLSLDAFSRNKLIIYKARCLGFHSLWFVPINTRISSMQNDLEIKYGIWKSIQLGLASIAAQS